MTRIDHINDPNAPKANSIIPAASAIIEDNGKILLQQRSDSQSWALPGGTMEIGENINGTLQREVKEETGLDVEPNYIVGIYSDPQHVIEYSNGEIRQEFSICFACKAIGGNLQGSDESLKIGFFTPNEIKQLKMEESIRLRIQHYLEHRNRPIIA